MSFFKKELLSIRYCGVSDHLEYKVKGHDVLYIKSRAVNPNSYFNCQVQCRDQEVVTTLSKTELSQSDGTSCGLSARALINGKIINGQPVIHPGTYPWQVILTHSGVFFCGGALIASVWVLTAGMQVLFSIFFWCQIILETFKRVAQP